ncbi:MAG: hypothetical protein ACFCD0_05100 [Gemmataceae bacterium]
MAIVPVSQLVAPISVGLVDAYGGWEKNDFVIWAAVEDRYQNRIVVCLDERQGSRTRHRLFEGARLPDRTGAKLIPLGSWEEGVIVPALSRWLDGALMATKRTHQEAFLEMMKYALVGIGSPPETECFPHLLG